MTSTPQHSTASATFTIGDAAELAVVERGGFVESRHAGSAIVLAPDGTAAITLGTPGAPILPRSSMKPFQALAMLNAGAPLTEATAAIAMASHSGTPAHVSLVRGILAQAGLDERALRCPAAPPADAGARDALAAAGVAPSPLTMGCSGKHAAMLLTCSTNGWDTEGYLDPEHEVQTRIRDVVERLTGEKVVTTVTDGCGAPVHAMSLAGLARGVQRIATASASSPFALFRHAAALRDAVLANAWAIDGPGRANTAVVERLRLFAKWGAEGVMVAAAPDGTTVALKMLDGGGRAAVIVALALLVDAGALSAQAVTAVIPELGLEVLGGGRPVGGIRPSYRRSAGRRAD